LATINRTGELNGSIVFNLSKPFSVASAMDPSSEFFNGITSTEYRLIMSTPRLWAITDFIGG